jgi:hypothetical protein
MPDDLPPPVPPAATLDMKTLAEQIAAGANADTKSFLGKVLVAVEAQSATVTELKAKLEAAEVARTTAETAARDRTVKTEIRAAAKAAGAANDGDALAFIDTTKVTFNDAGEPTNIAELVAQVQKDKPYLFGSKSTSSTVVVPPVKEPSTKRAIEMTQEENDAALTALGVNVKRIRRQ